jgi:16S rRNA (cytosine1402-N4)-methyltransferase
VSAHPDFQHEPVMASEVLGWIDPHDEKVLLDGTVGGGGHAALMMERCPTCRLIAVDRDPEALAAARARLAPFGDRVCFVEARFDRALDDARVSEQALDGVVLDLGVSSHQIDLDRRGFTFREGAPLDMRMAGQGPTAADLLNEESETELARIFYEYGEERRSRALAKAIVARREVTPFATSDDLVGVLTRVLGRSTTHQDKARIFQALRIAVNGELEALERVLPKLRDALAGSGVLVVIAYHSLEDRIVKHAFRDWSRACVCPSELPVCTCRGRALGETLTRRGVRASADEIEANPRARSAVLRAWRKAA